MATLSYAQIAQYAGMAGFSGESRVIATAIGMAESSGRTHVINFLGCVGIWQIYQRVHQPSHPHWTTSWLQNPANNAQAAWLLSNGGRNWRPWEVYTNGMYRRHMGPARQAIAGGGGGTPSPIPSSGDEWINPLLGTITSRYGPRWGTVHSGTDIAPTRGQMMIGAAHAGTVVYIRTGSFKGDRRLTRPFYGRSGNYVAINHGLYTTYYGHMARVDVRVGQQVQAGQSIGRVGNTGNVVGVNGTHLHFEVMRSGAFNSPFNPEPFMRARGVMLGSGRSRAISGGAYVPPPSVVAGMAATPWAFTFRYRLPQIKNTDPVIIHPSQRGN